MQTRSSDEKAVCPSVRLSILNMIATSGFLTAPECTKSIFGRGSPRSPLRELTAPPPPPTQLDLKGPTSKGGEERGGAERKGEGTREGRGGEGKEKGEEGRGGEGKGRKGSPLP